MEFTKKDFNKIINYINTHPYIRGPQQNLKIGNNCKFLNTVLNTNSGIITIGDDTFFSHGCMVITGYHLSRKKITRSGRDITIGKNCWIASGVIINGNVTIGDNCVIGAGSVVTKDIPDNSFAVGIPAKVIKQSFIIQDET